MKGVISVEIVRRLIASGQERASVSAVRCSGLPVGSRITNSVVCGLSVRMRLTDSMARFRVRRKSAERSRSVKQSAGAFVDVASNGC